MDSSIGTEGVLRSRRCIRFRVGLAGKSKVAADAGHDAGSGSRAPERGGRNIFHWRLFGVFHATGVAGRSTVRLDVSK